MCEAPLSMSPDLLRFDHRSRRRRVFTDIERKAALQRLREELATIERRRLIIEKSVAQVFGVPAKEIGKTSRGRANVALARQVAMYIDHIACGDTMTEVGELFARDRTTVAHACIVIEDRRDDPMFDRVLDLLERVVRSLADPRPSGIAPT